ncbi:hypothetical protein Tco_0300045 [Tanacetum coccineum]
MYYEVAPQSLYSAAYRILGVLHTVIPKTSSAAGSTIPSTIPPITPFQQQSTPTPTPEPTNATTVTLIPALPDFSSLYEFDQRVSKAKDERKRYIDLVEKSVKEIIKDEVKSQLPDILPKEVSDYATPVIQSTITVSLENIILAKSSPQLKSTYEAAASLTEFELKKILLDKIRNNKDKDEDPPAGSDQGLKKRKTSKDVDLSRGSKSKEPKSSSSKGSKSQPKSSGKSSQAKELVFETADTEMPLNQGEDLGNTNDQPTSRKLQRMTGKPPLTFDELMTIPIVFSAYVMNNLKIENLTQEYLVGPSFNLLNETCKSRVELKYHFEECYKAVTDRVDWTNPKGNGYPFDLSKPLPLIQNQGRQVVPANYFFNNNLKYVKEDMVPSLWSPVKVAYDKYDMWGITHWVTHVKVMKWYDYGYLEENVVQREDQQLYKLKEGDFPRLNLRDIEDLLLLLVQKKLSNLEKDVIYDLNVALRMFTRHIVILKWVEDLQLAVESYQKKLNITRPETFRLMRSDELYKFCDGTLTSVRRVLHDIASSLEMDYLPKRRWTKLDRNMSHIMIKAIDQQLFERRLMRNLEKFVGGREYGEDFRLLERTI